jgi:membrane protein implicated in regulation of membrane protease activity
MSIRESVIKFVGTMVVVLAIMAAVLVFGRLAGGVYWVAAVAFCIVAYVAMVASGAVLRQKLARWRSQSNGASERASSPTEGKTRQ